MENIKKIYGEEFLKQLPKNQIGLPYFLSGQDKGAQVLRQEFNKYLQLAVDHKIIDQDFNKRIKAKEWPTFFQKYQELAAAHFIEKILGYKITFNPKGRDQRILEFSINLPDKRIIYVEVKSPTDEPTRQYNKVWAGASDVKRIRRNIRRALRQMKVGMMNLVILSAKMKVPLGDEIQMIEALYDIKTTSGKNVPLESKLSQVIYKGGDDTLISAVATLESKVNTSNRLYYIFKIYHNPNPSNPITLNIFKGFPQYIKDGAVMRWCKP